MKPHITNTDNPVDFPPTNKPDEHVAKQRSNAIVIALVGRSVADEWWSSPNRAFDMRTPAGMWVEDYERVYNYLMHHGFAGGGS